MVKENVGVLLNNRWHLNETINERHVENGRNKVT